MSTINIWVINASPLIFFAKTGNLSILTTLADQVVIPDKVAQEVLGGDSSDPAYIAVKSGWGQTASGYSIQQSILDCKIGNGESAVIAIALSQPSSIAILDDNSARKCAKKHGVAYIGSLGILAIAKQQGIIPLVGPVIKAMMNVGMYLADSTIAQALSRIGETWPL